MERHIAERVGDAFVAGGHTHRSPSFHGPGAWGRDGGTPSAEEGLRTAKAARSELCPTKNIESLAQIMTIRRNGLRVKKKTVWSSSAQWASVVPQRRGVVVRIRYRTDGADGAVHFNSLDMPGILQAHTLYADTAKKACRR